MALIVVDHVNESRDLKSDTEKGNSVSRNLFVSVAVQFLHTYCGDLCPNVKSGIYQH